MPEKAILVLAEATSISVLIVLSVLMLVLIIFSALISGCSSSDGEVQITLQSCDGQDAMVWNLKGATLDSESYSSSIGSNKTVDLTFGVQLGGVDDLQNGIICSGSGQARPVFGI